MSMRPLARTQDVLTETLDDELLVYDEERDIACRLNRSAAVVWQHADGHRTVPELLDILRAEIGEVADEDLVLVTLDRLEEEGLLEAGYERRETGLRRLSRRRFIRRVGAVSTAAMAFPVIQSIVAPTPASAASHYYTTTTTSSCVTPDRGSAVTTCTPTGEIRSRSTTETTTTTTVSPPA